MWSAEHYIFALTIIILLTFIWIYRWINPKSNGFLPPGSSGIPLVRESLELLIPSYNFDIPPFFKKRMQRYGPLFRTNVAGYNLIVSTDEDFNRFIFQQEGRLVVRCFLDLFENVFKVKEFEKDAIHQLARSLIVSQFGLGCIKEKLLSQFEQFVRTTIHSWSLKYSVEVKSASTKMFADFGAKQPFGNDIGDSKELADKFLTFYKDLMSFPLNIPGTSYHKCLKEKDKALDMIRNVLKARLAAAPQNIQDDMLSKIVNDMDKFHLFTEEYIAQMLFGVSVAVTESIPQILPFAMKFISENPAVQQELIAEHEEILKRREKLDSSVTWEEYKSMTFTLQVIYETLRLADPVPGFFKRAVKDIQVNGYTIPAGWIIMIYQSGLNLDPKTYKDPLTFDPWRWKGASSEFMSKNLRAFGVGDIVHFPPCIGHQIQVELS